MTLPDGHRFRAVGPDDLDAIVEVLAGVLEADFIRSDWTRAGFDPERDAWVVTDPAGVVVAYGLAVPDGPGAVESWGAVHPDRQGQGIGAAVLERIERRSAELLAGAPGGTFRHVIDAGDEAAPRLCAPVACGPCAGSATCSSTSTAPSTRVPSRPAWRSSPWTPVATCAPCTTSSSAPSPSTGPLPGAVRALGHECGGRPGYDPGLWLLARAGDEPAGILVAEVLDGQGWIADLGVLAPCAAVASAPPCCARVRRLLGARAARGAAQRRQPERDGRDRALRTRGHARDPALGRLGAGGRRAGHPGVQSRSGGPGHHLATGPPRERGGLAPARTSSAAARPASTRAGQSSAWARNGRSAVRSSAAARCQRNPAGRPP